MPYFSWPGPPHRLLHVCAFQTEPFALRSTFTIYLTSSVCSAALVLVSQHFKIYLSFPMDTFNFLINLLKAQGVDLSMACPFASAGVAAQSAGCLCLCSSGQAAGSSLLFSIGRSLDHPWSTWHNAKQGSFGSLHLPVLETLLEVDLQSECTCLENLEAPAHVTGSGMQPLLNLTWHWDPSHSSSITQKLQTKASRVSFVMVLSQHPQASSTHLVTLIPVFKASVLGRGLTAHCW